MLIHFVEQDVVDACCVLVASNHNTQPQDVQIDLAHSPNEGFSAEAKMGWRNVYLSQQDIVDAICMYLSQYHNFIPNDLRVDMIFDMKFGIEADIQVG